MTQTPPQTDGLAWETDPHVLRFCGTRLRDLVASLLEAASVNTHSIEFRAKSEESIQRKIEQKNDPLYTRDTMTDLLGLRIITHFHDEVDQVATIIESQFSIDYSNSVDKRQNDDPERFGYMSVHYVGTLNPTRQTLEEYSKFSRVRFEIQIRSILQHAWAEIEHDLGYKSKSSIPAFERRRFSRLAGLLELADSEFASIRKNLDEHASAVDQAVQADQLDVGIDQDSLKAYMIHGSIPAEIERSVAEQIGKPYDSKTEAPNNYSGRSAALFGATSLNLIRDVDRRIRKERDLVTTILAHFFKENHVPNLPVGASVYTLALIEAARLPTDAAKAAFANAKIPQAHPIVVKQLRIATKPAAR